MVMIALILIGLIALQHFGFLVLEMFLWTKPLGRRVFRLSETQAEATRVLAGNQGLYNGFLSAGLLWGLVHPQPALALQIRLFFLGCVIVAGLYGGATVSRRIWLIQALPAALALAALAAASF